MRCVDALVPKMSNRGECQGRLTVVELCSDKNVHVQEQESVTSRSRQSV
jgi:hypothetical protein